MAQILRMSGAIPSLHRMLSWRAHRENFIFAVTTCRQLLGSFRVRLKGDMQGLLRLESQGDQPLRASEVVINLLATDFFFFKF